MQLLKRLDHAAVTAAIAAVLYGLFMAQYLRAHDPAFLVQAGEYFVDATQTPPNLFTVTDSTGYDGTFFYRLALTPFTRERTAFGITLDTPRYRHQRILYPLLAWAFSFGSPPLALSALISVNYLALGGLGWLAGLAAKSAGRHALWGLALALYPGFLITFSRDLAEIIEALFVLAVSVAWQRQRPGAAAGFLALAILAKETALLGAVAAGIIWAWQAWRGRERPKVQWVLIPLLVYAAW